MIGIIDPIIAKVLFKTRDLISFEVIIPEELAFMKNVNINGYCI